MIYDEISMVATRTSSVEDALRAIETLIERQGRR